MSRGVNKRTIEAIAFQNVPRGGDPPAPSATPGRTASTAASCASSTARYMRFTLAAGRAHVQHAGHVAGVALLLRAHIHHHQVGRFRAVPAVGCACGSAERAPPATMVSNAGLLGSQPAHAVFQLGSQVALLHPRPHTRGRLFEGAASWSGRTAGSARFRKPISPCGAARSSPPRASAPPSWAAGTAGHRRLRRSCAPAHIRSTTHPAGGSPPDHIHHQRAFADLDPAGGLLGGLDRRSADR